MKKAMIRLEDIGPGGPYQIYDNLLKLKVIGEYLRSEGVPFHISLIPRFVDPENNYDKSIDEIGDPFIQTFNNTIKYLQNFCSAFIGMHGYTHQYAKSKSAEGYEFNYTPCATDCPPDDSAEALLSDDQDIMSYAYSRLLKGYNAFEKSGIRIDFGFSTPHYAASAIQRSIIESSAGIIFESPPGIVSERKLLIKDTNSPLYRGVIYVPTPLGYVRDAEKEKDVHRILTESRNYGEDDLASFFFHPPLEFPFIHINREGFVTYDSNSPLKQLIKGIKTRGFTFVPLTSLMDFIPFSKITNIFPGKEYIILTGNVKKGKKTEIIAWEQSKGNWYFCDLENINQFPKRLSADENANVVRALSGWAAGNHYKVFAGDFNGDGHNDIVVWEPRNGTWQVAVKDQLELVPDKGWGDYLWLKNWAQGSSFYPLIGDFNGDGKEDIVVWDSSEGSWQVALSTGSGFYPSEGKEDYKWLKNWAVGNDWIPVAGDFNGDGKSDIAVWNKVTGEWQVALSNGRYFVPSSGLQDHVWLRDWGKGDDWIPLAGDLDEDGKADIMLVHPEKGLWQIALSTGRQFVPTGKIFGSWAAGSNMQPFIYKQDPFVKPFIMARHPDLYNGDFDFAYNIISI